MGFDAQRSPEADAIPTRAEYAESIVVDDGSF
jgi:hypothetical protein